MDGYIILGVIVVLAGLLLARKKGGVRAVVDAVTPKSGWHIGPVVRGVNLSRGMPEKPYPDPQGGWSINFPDSSGEVHAVVNHSPPSLVGAREVRLHYSVVGGGFTPSEFTTRDALVTFGIQRKGDNWSGTGKYASYRWYSKQVVRLEPGINTLSVPLNAAAMSNVNGQSSDVSGLASTISDLDNLSVLFGHSSGRGHGVYATEPSSFTLHGVEVMR